MKLKIEHHITYFMNNRGWDFDDDEVNREGPKNKFSVMRWMPPEYEGSSEEGYWSQIGSFDSEDNANTFVHQFKLQYQPDKIIEF